MSSSPPNPTLKNYLFLPPEIRHDSSLALFVCFNASRVCFALNFPSYFTFPLAALVKIFFLFYVFLLSLSFLISLSHLSPT
jgi:hypothetical protein